MAATMVATVTTVTTVTIVTGDCFCEDTLIGSSAPQPNSMIVTSRVCKLYRISRLTLHELSMIDLR